MRTLSLAAAALLALVVPALAQNPRPPAQQCNGALPLCLNLGGGQANNRQGAAAIDLFGAVQNGVNAIQAARGAANGIATLDANGHLPPAEFSLGTFPFSGMTRSGIAGSIASQTASSIVASGFQAAGDGGAGCIFVPGTASGPAAVRDTLGAWWQLALNRPINPRCLGAIGDGNSHPLSSRYATLAAAQADYPTATSLTQEIDEAAIRQAMASAAGGIGGFVHVTLPPGAYRACNLQLGSNTTITGSGTNSSILLPASPTCDVLRATDPVGMGNVLIQDVGFTTAAQQTAGAFVRFQNCTNCRATNFQAANGWDGVVVDGNNMTQVLIDHGYILNNRGTDITINGGADHYIDKIVGTAYTQCGLKITSSAGTWVTDSDFVHHVSGTCLWPAAGTKVQSIFVSDSALGDTSTQDGLSIVANAGTVEGIKVVNSWTSSNGGRGMYSTCSNGGKVRHLEFIGHTSVNNGKDGAYLDCATDVKFIGGSFFDNANANNGGASASGSGIVFGIGAVNFRVNDVNFASQNAPNQAYSVAVLDPASDVYDISHNTFYGGSTTGALLDSGTGTHKIVSPNLQ